MQRTKTFKKRQNVWLGELRGSRSEEMRNDEGSTSFLTKIISHRAGD